MRCLKDHSCAEAGRVAAPSGQEVRGEHSVHNTPSGHLQPEEARVHGTCLKQQHESLHQAEGEEKRKRKTNRGRKAFSPNLAPSGCRENEGMDS